MLETIKGISSALYVGSFLNSFSNADKEPKEGKTTDITHTLDPMTTVIQIALLAFMEPGTLIGIKDNNILHQEPSTYVAKPIQGGIRWLRGNSREDLGNLIHYIRRAAQWYHPEKNVKNKSEIDPEQNPKQKPKKNHSETNNPVTTIFEACRRGWEELQKTYEEKKSKNTPSAIANWISEIDTALKEGLKTDEPLTPLAECIKPLWSEKDFTTIANLLPSKEDLRDTPREELRTRIVPIEEFLKDKVMRFRKIQNEIATKL